MNTNEVHSSILAKEYKYCFFFTSKAQGFLKIARELKN